MTVAARVERQVLTRGEAGTMRLAGRLMEAARAGDVVALVGDLGAGKTRFVEGAARALGYRGRVRSPSFTLLNIYRAALPIYHFDLYRWEPATQGVEWEEWEERIDGDGVSLIEWADRLETEIPARSLLVRIAHAGDERRLVTVGAAEAHHRRQLQALCREVAGGLLEDVAPGPTMEAE